VARAAQPARHGCRAPSRRRPDRRRTNSSATDARERAPDPPMQESPMYDPNRAVVKPLQAAAELLLGD
jgi:hypothetical protein